VLNQILDWRGRMLIALFLTFMSSSWVGAVELRLAIANSTCEAMKQVGDLYQKSNDVQFTYVCKSTGLLAKGLAGKALSAHIFISADREWMDYVVERGLVSSRQVTSTWGNVLVLAAPQASPLELGNWAELASDKVATILIGDPGTAPFGRYAKQALEAAGLWERVRHKISTRKNIELLAESLARADARTVGFIFKSNLSDQLRELMPVRKSWHQPIRYYMAPLNPGADDEEIRKFLGFMQSRAVKDIFQAEHFDVSPP
jgi:molybdate transport system substrate-binding protein